MKPAIESNSATWSGFYRPLEIMDCLYHLDRGISCVVSAWQIGKVFDGVERYTGCTKFEVEVMGGKALITPTRYCGGIKPICAQ